MTRGMRTPPLLDNQGGQAMTEFVIAAVFLLVPLFILVPLLGKYIDIKHAAIQQARYEAWEYSVWWGPSEYIMTGVDTNQRAGIKSFEKTREEGLHIFFSNPNRDDYGEPTSSFSLPPIWRDHHGLSLFTKHGMDISSGEQKEDKTPDPVAGVFDFVINFFSDVLTLIGDILHLIGIKAKFDAMDIDGYFKSSVNLVVRSTEQVLPYNGLEGPTYNTQAKPLEIEGKAAVLTNSWNAGGREQAIQESRGLVMTAALSPLSDTVNTILYGLRKVQDYIPIKAFQLPSMPAFGYVRDDLIPYEHLKDNKQEVKESYGLYYYAEKSKKKKK